MTYQEMLDSRPARMLEAASRKAQYLASCDPDEMELARQEREDYDALSEE